MTKEEPLTTTKEPWKTIRRETGLVEHLCEHGVGHPNHGSALWMAEAQSVMGHDLDDRYRARLIHGCDGCCGRDDFPGTTFGSLRHAHEIIREFKAELEEAALEMHDHRLHKLKRLAWVALPWWWRAWFRLTWRKP